ncbi:MAG: hypothetical protein V7K25_23925 [Nostoc sp.]
MFAEGFLTPRDRATHRRAKTKTEQQQQCKAKLFRRAIASF